MTYQLWDFLGDLKETCDFAELSHELSNDSPFWSGIPEGSAELSKTVFDRGSSMLECLIRTFKFPGQFGTRIDFPGRFVKDRELSESYSVESMFYPLCVIDITAKVKEDVHCAAQPADIPAREEKYGRIL